MTAPVGGAVEFIDAALQYESTWERAEDHESRHGSGLEYYGASMGAVRGTVRDARRRFPDLTHDDVTALASELWGRPVLERRQAAIVLLQGTVPLLRASDLTRVEGFLRSALLPDLVDPLAIDVVGPLLLGLTGHDAMRARSVVERWAADDNAWLRRAAVLVHLPAYRAGRGDDGAFRRVVRLVGGVKQGRVTAVEEALARVRAGGAA